ncbi:hypothetical protein MLD38_007307 [Melastoma candidum]|uniref:Uncharacterized protein n=1 Tax=Melastoma candidum TaxID=119954 RepID=A0ACB9RPY9_9MYRT|nr:hypothetical protein MLD38_007307 [Melastoma candidum]
MFKSVPSGYYPKQLVTQTLENSEELRAYSSTRSGECNPEFCNGSDRSVRAKSKAADHSFCNRRLPPCLPLFLPCQDDHRSGSATVTVFEERRRGNQRKISVYKRGNEFEGDKKDNISCLSLSTEGKKILNDLFIRYPPGDGVETEAIEKRGVSNREKRKMGIQDEFFLKPSTSQTEIKQKVESLSSRLAREADLRQITEKRSKLPITSFKDTITSAVNSHQVVLISGETGCGKTTQVPQCLLDTMWAVGKVCKIVCTQPRRISAISVAERISSGRGENVGGDVGYKIWLESKGGKHSSVLLCTNGILLKVLVSNNPSGSKEGLKNQKAGGSSL